MNTDNHSGGWCGHLHGNNQEARACKAALMNTTNQTTNPSVSDYVKITDCGDYWRIKWLDDDAITTTSKQGLPTRTDVKDWIRYVLEMPHLTL